MVDPEIRALEARTAGQNMTPILRDAQLPASTWFRWRKGEVAPTLSKLRQLQAAVDKHLAKPSTDQAA